VARRQKIVLYAVEERGMEFHHLIKQVILGNVVQRFGFDFELGPASGSITGEEFLDRFSYSYLLKNDSAHGVSVVPCLVSEAWKGVHKYVICRLCKDSSSETNCWYK